MKHIWKFIVIVPIIIGVIFGIMITFKNGTVLFDEKEIIKNVFENVSSKPAEVTKFYTFGTSLNIEGKIAGISKDNFEGAKIVVTDGQGFQKEYKIKASFEDNSLLFNGENINQGIKLDELDSRKKIFCAG